MLNDTIFVIINKRVFIGVKNLAISYKPLWKTMIDKDRAKKDLREELKLSPTIIASLTKNEYVSLKTIENICNYLECEIQDVVELVKEEKEK